MVVVVAGSLANQVEEADALAVHADEQRERVVVAAERPAEAVAVGVWVVRQRTRPRRSHARVVRPLHEERDVGFDRRV